MNFRTFAVVPLVVATAGCLGSEPTEGQVLAENFAQAVENDGAFGDIGEDAVAQLDAMSGLQVTSEANLPTGTATYEGQIGVGTPTDGVIGSMEASVSLAGTGSFEGEAYGFSTRMVNPSRGHLRSRMDTLMGPSIL